MIIRAAVSEDLDEIMKIYERARKYMAENGNPNQWIGGYPNRSLIENDIFNQTCHVCIIKNNVEGVFNLAEGTDPTYGVIKDGAWLNDKPYATIHRIASSGRYKGILEQCVIWCAEKYDNIRADTHCDNKIMQHLLTKNGFIRCGIIYLANGSPRIAYHKVIKGFDKND